jgi:hypothetical protein
MIDDPLMHWLHGIKFAETKALNWTNVGARNRLFKGSPFIKSRWISVAGSESQM